MQVRCAALHLLWCKASTLALLDGRIRHLMMIGALASLDWEASFPMCLQVFNRYDTLVNVCQIMVGFNKVLLSENVFR